MTLTYTGSFDDVFLSPEFFDDPYPYYHQLRSDEPVYWSERLNAWLLTRYEDALAALSDKRLGSAGRIDVMIGRLPPRAQPEFQPLLEHMNAMMAFTDPPDHTRLRRLVGRAFTPRAASRLRDQIQSVVDELLEAMVAKREVDLVHEFAFQLPSIVISDMLGVPLADRESLKTWSDDIVNFVSGEAVTVDIARRAQGSVSEARAYLLDLAEDRRRQPRDDLMSVLVEVADDGDQLTEDELVSMCVLLFFAGFETTEGLIGNGLLALMDHPDQMQQLHSDPALIDTAVEEFLRYDNSIQRQSRVAREDFLIGDKQIKKGDYVAIMIGAANRDPEQFPEPDSLEIIRDPNRHVAFGHGIHSCLGRPLARLEGQIAISAIVQRFPEMRRLTQNLEWEHLLAIRKLKTLLVSIEGGHGCG